MSARLFPPWQEFVAQYWETRPEVFREVDSLLCNETSVFDGLKEAGDELRSGRIRDHRDVSFHLADAAVVDPGPYLPRAGHSLDTYLSHLDRGVGQQPFTLLVNNFHEFSADLCLRMRLVARHLFEHLGLLPAGTVSSHVMLARYGTSPFAVHKDPNSVFTFVIRGRKTLRVWPFEAFADRAPQPFARHRQLNLYDFDYRKHVATSTALTGDPGDVLYWPSTYWHVGETDGRDVHISLHLTFDLHSEPRAEAVDLLQRAVEDSRSEADWHSGYPVDNLRRSGPLRPPDRLLDALRSVTEGAHGALVDSVTALWLSRMSAQGFWTLARSSAAQHPVVDVARATLQPDQVFPVYWIRQDGWVTLAAHGRVVRFPVRAWTEAFLGAVSEQRPFRVTDVASAAPELSGEIAAVATKLVAIGALHLAGEPCSTSSS